jgi:hypothetical protein
MYRLHEPLPRLISTCAGDHGERLPWTVEIEDMCSQCGTYCDYPNHYYTPPESPLGQGFTNLTNLDVSIYTSATATANQNRSANNNIDTPYYPHAPPSTPITAAHDSDHEHSIQLWSSEVYKAIINFSPTELPDHLRDSGGWRYMPAEAELAILFGPEAARPFNWAPNTGDSESDKVSSQQAVATSRTGFSKFFWGPLQLEVDKTASNTRFPQITGEKSGSSLNLEEVQR